MTSIISHHSSLHSVLGRLFSSGYLHRILDRFPPNKSIRHIAEQLRHTVLQAFKDRALRRANAMQTRYENDLAETSFEHNNDMKTTRPEKYPPTTSWPIVRLVSRVNFVYKS